MSSLVSLSGFKLYLGSAPSAADDALLSGILDNVEALFESETGRSIGAYQGAGTARTEVHDGTGSRELYLDYPPSTLTSVKLGFDASAPLETLAVADRNVITFGADSRRLSRTDGGIFGAIGQSRYVQVVYDFPEALPSNAKLAIQSVAAVAYRRRGSEEATSERIGTSYDRAFLGDICADDPFWQKAVAANLKMMAIA